MAAAVAAGSAADLVAQSRPGGFDLPPLKEAPPATPRAIPGPSACDDALSLPDVYLHSGEFHLEAVDLVIKGRGLDFVWQRRYRSRLPITSGQGVGWDFSYNLFIQSAGAYVRLWDGNGRSDVYRRRPDGSFVAKQFFREGKFNADGTFTMLFADLGTWRFRALDGSAAAGKIETIADRHGNALKFAYDAAGRLAVVTDTLNRAIKIAWNADGFIQSLTDFAGRQVVFTYHQDGSGLGGFGDLASARSPIVTGTPNGNDFPAGKVTSYTYSTGASLERLNHNLLTVTDPLGQTWLQNVYGQSDDAGSPKLDRLIRQVRGDAGDNIDISYEVSTLADAVAGVPPHCLIATVNDRVGNVKQYRFDSRGRCVLMREFTGRADPDQPTTLTENLPTGKLRAEDPGFFDTILSYNEDSRITQTVHPNGNVSRIVHELELDPSAAWRSRGNVRQIHKLPGDHVPAGDQAQISEFFEYVADFGGCCGTNFVSRHTDARGNVTEHLYDVAGNRVKTIHRIPSIVELFDYNANGQMVTHAWPDNGSGHIQVDAWSYYDASDGAQNGYLESEVVDVLGESLTNTWVYDLVGNPIQVTDARGNQTDMVFNSLNQVVRRISPKVFMSNGVGVRYEVDTAYDANDNVVQVDVQDYDEAGQLQTNAYLSTRYEFEILNKPVRCLRELDATRDVVTEWEYDSNRNRIVERSGEAVRGTQPGNFVLRQFDERDLPFRETRGAGSTAPSTRQFDYDGNRALVRTHDGIELGPHVSSTVVDAYGRAVLSTDSMGNVTSSNYDPNSNLVHFRVDGELCDVQGGAGNVRLQEAWLGYDAMDRLVTREFAHFDPVSQTDVGDGKSLTSIQWTDRSRRSSEVDDLGYVTSYSYDTVNRLAKTTDAAGNVVETTYDEHHNPIQVLATEVSDSGAPPQQYLVSRSFDSVDRVIGYADALGQETTLGYDSRDNLKSIVDALGNSTQLVFDGLDRLLASTRWMTDDGTGGGTVVGKIELAWEWDDNSRLVRQVDGIGNATVYAYDDLDRPIATTFADATVETAAYDVHGNVLIRVDANGTIVNSVFDQLDRIVARKVAPGAGVSAATTSESWKHDGLSRLVHAENNVSIVTFLHDSLSNRAAETQDGRLFQFTHDGVGNQLAAVYPGGKVITRTFDGLRRVKDITNAGPTASYDYVGPDRVESRVTGNAIASSAWQYDGGRRLTALNQDAGGTQLDRRAYQWDAQYDKTQSADVRTGGPGYVSDYTYDSQYRMVRVLVSAGGSTVRDTQYSLDEAGNRLAVTGDGCPGTYVLDATQPEPADRQMNQYTSTPCISLLEYDRNGNETGRGGAASSIFDYRNRLVEHQDAGGAVTQYAYDALGRRIRTTFDDGSEVRRLFIGSDVVEERDGKDVVIAEYVRGRNGELVEMVRSGVTRYFFSDDLGSIRVATDSKGKAVERYEFDDYGTPSFFDGAGNPLGQSAIGNPYLFTGQRFDPESGWYDYKARSMDPQTGRFLGRDPIGIWGDPGNVGNPRTYVGNNPQTLTDPTGLFSEFSNCSGPWPGPRLILWNANQCSRRQEGTINGDLCRAMRAAGKADRGAQNWLTNALLSETAPAWQFDQIPFWEYFGGADGVISPLSKVRVRNAFDQIWRPFEDGWQLYFRCKTEDPFYCIAGNAAAYVLPGDDDEMRLCSGYFSRGDVRRASTILHEMSHLYAGTDDKFYYADETDITTAPGMFETQALIDNADTYQGVYLKWYLE